MKSRPIANITLMAQTMRFVRQYESVKIIGIMPIAIAATMNQKRREVRTALIAVAYCRAISGLDIFFAFLSDEPCRAYGESQQKKRKDDNIDQARVKKLRRITLDKTDEQSSDDRPFDIAEAPDNYDGKGF